MFDSVHPVTTQHRILEDADKSLNDDGIFFSTLEKYSSSRYYPHEGNSTITTSVTIHVTPAHYHLLNWAILWGGFLIGIGIASCQVRRENLWLASRKRDGVDLEQQHQSGVGGIADGEGVSSADWTRSRFRRLLLLAMVARAVMIPVQMWSNPLWAQFVADTLPEMAFASAWALLVSFFVQLVGVALGSGANVASATPDLTMQVIAYVVYVAVLGAYFWNPVASVLLYALLCCIYAALFGTALYFCPRLLLLLQPSLVRHSGLAIRMAACSILCVFVFGCRTIGFARKLVAPPARVSWLWQYGMLELIPAVVFLLMMHPKSPSATVSANPAASGSPQSTGGRNNSSIVRSNSHSASPASTGNVPLGNHSSNGQRHPIPSGSGHRQQDSHLPQRGRIAGETTPLLKPPA